MSATLAALLHELDPSLRLLLVERLEAPALESSVGREQCRHRPCGQLRAELHADAARWQRRHGQGCGDQCRL